MIPSKNSNSDVFDQNIFLKWSKNDINDLIKFSNSDLILNSDILNHIMSLSLI
jgi:hypothetical protein